MLSLILVLGVPLTFVQCEAYVLLQVRKQDANHSNVDALIHKVVPSGKFDKFAKRMGQRAAEEQAKTKKPVNKAVETDEDAHNNGLAIPAPRDTNEPTFNDIITLVARKFASGPSGTVFRSKSEGYLFKPKTVRLPSGTSSLYRVHPDTVVDALNELLSSITLKKYVDKLSRKAAVVYRTVENDVQPLASSLLRFKF